MADLEPQELIERLEGSMPRPEFVAELRTRVHDEALGRAAAVDAAAPIVEPTDPVEGRSRMSRSTLIGLAAAAAVIVIVGLAIWTSGGDPDTEVDTVDRPEETDVPAADEESQEAPTTTTVEPEIVPAPDVPRPDPDPPREPSTLDFDAWLAEVTVFADDRHEGDWQHFVAGPYGQLLALRDQATDRSEGYAFTSQCDLLPFTSAHVADAPGLPENPAIAEVYQELLDNESASWAWLQAKCDAVDHDLVRAGLAEFPSLDTVSDFLRGGNICSNLRSTIEAETGTAPDFLCLPQEPGARDVEDDRELPEDFRVYLEGYAG